MPNPTLPSTPQIEITPPRLLTLGAGLAVSAYGLFLVAPIFVSILAVSLLKFGILTLAIPVLALVVTAYFLPFGLGNARVGKLVRALGPPVGRAEDAFIVQVTLSPRIRSGVRALLEDADDFGWLSFTDSALVFKGDSIKFSSPFDQIRSVRPQNVGLRGRFVYGRRVSIVVSGLPNVESLEFAERSSWLLPTSKKITKQLYQRFSAKVSH